MYNYNIACTIYIHTSESSLNSCYACKCSHGQVYTEITVPLVLLSFLVVPPDVGRGGSPELLPSHHHHCSPNPLHPLQMTTALCGTEVYFQVTHHPDKMVFFMNTELRKQHAKALCICFLLNFTW